MGELQIAWSFGSWNIPGRDKTGRTVGGEMEFHSSV